MNHSSFPMQKPQSFGLDENITSALLLGGTAAVLLLPKLCWLAWVLPVVFLVAERENVYVRKCAVHGLAGTLTAMVFMALCSSLLVVSGVMAGGNLIRYFLDGGSFNAQILVALLLFLGGIVLQFIVRLIFAIFLVVAAFRAWHYENLRIPIASAIVAKRSPKYQ